MHSKKELGNRVIVTVDGKMYQEFSLDQNGVFVIIGANGGTNLLKIEDGFADVTDASCPDKLCVHQKSVHYNGETIVCLPNKVVVEIISEIENEIDTIAN